MCIEASVGRKCTNARKDVIIVQCAWNYLRYCKHLLTSMQTRSIDTPLRRAHFLAQLGHESGSFKYAEEIASGAAYEGRADLGNTEKGDGVRFKGRGLIQLTGRANHVAYGASIGQAYLKTAKWFLVYP